MVAADPEVPGTSTHDGRRYQMLVGHWERDAIPHGHGYGDEPHPTRWDGAHVWVDEGDQFGSFTTDRPPWVALKDDAPS